MSMSTLLQPTEQHKNNALEERGAPRLPPNKSLQREVSRVVLSAWERGGDEQ